MSRTLIADQIKETFIKSLGSLGASVETMRNLASNATDPAIRQLFERLGQAGRDVYMVKEVGFINVHVKSVPPGWWNVLKSVKSDMDAIKKGLGIRCYYVLLIGRDDKFVADGYLATDFNAIPFVKHPGIEATKYSINEKQHLDSSMLLRSVEKVAKELLNSKKGA